MVVKVFENYKIMRKLLSGLMISNKSIMVDRPSQPWPKKKLVISYIVTYTRHARMHGVTCHDFGNGRAVGVPGSHPIYILGEVKKHTHSYTSHSENCTHSYSIFQILPIYILFGWKRYLIDILLMWKCYPLIYSEAWKVYPFQPHICIYLYNRSYPSPRTRMIHVAKYIRF